MLERCSVLATRLAAGQDPVPENAALRMSEIRGFTIRQVSSFPGTTKAMEEALENEFHARMPHETGGVAHASATLIFRIGPEQLWLVGRQGDQIEARIRSRLNPDESVLTELSNSRARIALDGAKATAVLAKGIALDFDLSEFRPDTIALTGVHHMPLLVHRIAETRFELYVMRTFAICVWDWLVDASLEFGCTIAKHPEAA